jgi:subtilisin family serine protease
MIFTSFILHQNTFGQTWQDAVMDSVLKVFPADSLYTKNEVLIKFKKNALDLSKLCYSYSISNDNLKNNGKRVEGVLGLNDDLADYLDAQRFPVEELVLNSSLRIMMKMYGGDTLRRLTHANPCLDTLSLTRNGDTIPMADYLYLVLKLNNDTSVVPACVWLTALHQNHLEYVVPDIKYDLFTANDYEYPEQRSFHPDYIDAEFPWSLGYYGQPYTLVAVIDNGIDYRHCDFGTGQYGPGYKVIYGRTMNNNQYPFYEDSFHGTSVAGIIGALTNRTHCVASDKGVAGIAGGWGGNDDKGTGCSLLAYKVAGPFITAAAILQASHKSIHTPYGEGVHIINLSLGWEKSLRNLLPEVEDALNSAFENGVVVSSARSNQNRQGFNPTGFVLPPCFEPHKIISVGAYDHTKKKASRSSYGQQMDLLAPGPDALSGSKASQTPENIVYSTLWYNLGTHYWDIFGGTSSAAPHVSGSLALLHNYMVENNWTMYPEDYEGILKASATDITGSPYLTNFDHSSGWGNLYLKQMFFMLQNGYKLYHYTIDSLPAYDTVDYSGNAYQILLSNPEGRYNFEAGYWNALPRPVKVSITHQPKWLDNGGFKIYVWGRSGPHTTGAKHGWALTPTPTAKESDLPGVSINFQNGFTGVTSGFGGNNLTYNMIHDNTLINSHKFDLVTYQYQLTHPQTLDSYEAPLLENIAFHYTVFAKPDPNTSVHEQFQHTKLFLKPTITNSFITVESDLLVHDNMLLTITNLLGQEIYSKSEFNSNRHSVNISEYPKGVYFCSLSFGNHRITNQFIVY